MIWWITWMFAAYGKVFLVRKIRGPDRGHLYAMKVSASTIKRWELELKSWTPLYYNNDNASNQSNFAAGVEEGKHCAEEENNRAHKDGATGISSTHKHSFLKNSASLELFLIIIDDPLTCRWRCSRQSGNPRSWSPCITPFKRQPNFI